MTSNMPLKKIVIIGPESTGKSTLCEQLASHYHTQWCPEFAREYLLKHGTNYSFDDLLTIAKGQVALEEKYVSSMVNGQWSMDSRNSSSGIDHSPLTIQHSSLLFIDTDMYVMKVWCEFVFDKCHQWILDQIVSRRYDLYLLCNTDLPWVRDELREYPDLENRKKLFHIYKDIMINQDTPWVEISGDYDERLRLAIEAVNAAVLST
jgi:NadR type nicotinamide-nucleotide adenylyltransferase